MEKLEAGETVRRLEAAIEEARAFFGVDPMWNTPLLANTDGGAHVDMKIGYLEAPISVNLDFFQKYPERIREYMGHEVAHLLSAEVHRLSAVLPPEYRDTDTPAGRMFEDALESLTVRLERLFLRERQAPTI